MATIKDVAQEAGVSIATVSYVLNGTRSVRPDTVSKVKAAVKRLNYTPSRAAQSLITKSSRTIGILVSDISNPFFSPIVRGAEDVFSKAKYIVIVGNCDEDDQKARNYLMGLSEHRVDGLIISPTGQFDRMAKEIEQLGVPVVFVNRRPSIVKADVVETDNRLGAYLAVRHLCEMGHTRIGFICGPTVVSTYSDRLSGYCQALEESGITVQDNLICVGDYHFQTGYSLTRYLLELSDRPTALFVGSGWLTRGAFQALRDSQQLASREIAFATYDEVEWAQLVTPTLTTVEQDTYQMGHIAANLLLKRIDEQRSCTDSDERRVVKLPPRLLVRESSLVGRNR